MVSRALAGTKRSVPSLHGAALAAALVMAVCMGFGRFAYTGVYPVMVQEGLLSLHDGTLAASANYGGYLLGALLAARLASHRAYACMLVSLVAGVLCTFALAYTAQPWLVIAVRGAAGVFSALAMIGASLWLLHHKGFQQGAPVLFAGVGVGIFLSAELLAGAQYLGSNSVGLWLALGVASTLLGAIALLKSDGDAVAEQAASQDLHPSQTPIGAWPLIGAYGLAGFGYIITATYLPMFVKGSLGGINPIHVWAVFGLGAAPSCYLWHRVHACLGTHKALRANLLLQAVGVMLPVLAPTPFGYLGSALIVGGTFMGTVTIVMPAARRVAHQVKFNLIALMTAGYGTGQIIGPLLAGYLFARTGSFNGSLVAASLGLLVASVLTLRLPAGRKPAP